MQAGETATVDVALNAIDTTASDVTAINAAVISAVSVYNASGQPGSLAWDGTTLIFTSDGTGPMGDLVVQIVATADGFLEGPEDYSIQLSNAGSTTGSCLAIDPVDTVTTTINPDATSAQWSIGVDNSSNEGGSVQYTIGLTESFGAGDSASVDLTLNDVDTNASDYADFVVAVNSAVAAYAGPGTLTFDGTTLLFTANADGDAMTDLVIDLGIVNDALVEGVETLTVDLTNPAGPTGVNVSVSAVDASVTTTINDTQGVFGAPDTATWSIIGPVSGPEGSTAQYTVALDGLFGGGETASVVIDLNDLTTNSSDYASVLAAVTSAAAANPDVTFDAATQTLTYVAPSDGASMTDLVIDLGLATDAIVEGPEDFEITLSAAASTTGAAIAIDAAADTVTTTIIDQTIAPEWAISGPVTADEGASAQYTITLTGALGAGETATVEVALSDITTSPNDYASFDAAISAAVAGNPDLMWDAASGTLTFTAASDGAMLPPLLIDLAIVNDSFIEGPEQYSIELSNPGSTTGASSTLSATDFEVTTEINDTLGAGLGPDQGSWSIIGDTTVPEGGTAQYTVRLTGAFGAGETTTVDLGLSDVDTNSSDYASFVAAVNTAVAGYAGDGTLTFNGTALSFTATNDGDSLTNLIVDLNSVDDAFVEGPEDYTIALSNAASTTGAVVVLGANSVTTTIIDNDSAIWSITGDANVAEGADAKYVLSLTGTLQAGETALVDLNIGNVTAIAADYGSLADGVNDAIASYTGPGAFAFDGTTLTFTSDGSPMEDLCIEVATVDDALIEGDEDFQVSIANPATTTGSDVLTANPTVVVTTILDNDSATWSITGDASVTEGADAKYVLSLAGTLQAGETATIDLNIGNVTAIAADYGSLVDGVNDAIAAYAGPGSFAYDGTTLTFTSDGKSDGGSVHRSRNG